MVTRAPDDPVLQAEFLAQRLSSQPEDGEALRGLLELYERRVAGEPELERKLTLWGELAAICQRAGNTYGAVAALERARARAPEDVRVAHALASALVDHSAKTDGPSKAVYLDRVADLLCDVALALEPKEARKFLVAALGHAPWHARALYELERATGEAERNTLAGHWVAYLAHNPDGDLARERRVALARAYIAAGQIDDATFALEPNAKQGDREALALLAQLRGEAPAQAAHSVAAEPKPKPSVHNEETVINAELLLEHPELREPVLATRPAPGAHQATLRDTFAAEPYAAEQTEPSPSAGQSALRAELEAASASGDSARALQCAHDLVRIDANDELAFDFIEREFRRSRDHQHRAEFLLQMAQPEVVPRAKRLQRLRDAIALFEQKLSDPEGAVRGYRALLRIDPDDDDALRGLARVLERTEQWAALCECYERMLVHAVEPGQQSGLLRRIADVQRRELRDRSAAAAALSRLIDLDPNDRGARNALADDLTALERWDELARLYERRVEEPGTRAERIALLRQLADLFEGPLDDAEAAFEAYERIVALAPDDEQALARMEQIDAQSGAHERLLLTLTRRVERASAAQAVPLLLRMANIAEGDLLDRDRAHAYLRRALAVAPQNVQVALALADVCERGAQYEELLQLLHERSAAETDPRARAELLRRLARLQSERLGDDIGAADSYSALNQLGDDLEAWTFLEGFARRRLDSVGLSEALGKLDALDPEPARRRSRILERSLLLSQLGEYAAAVEPLVTLLSQIDPDDRQARERLEQLCQTLSDYRSLARVLEDQLLSAQSSEKRAALAQELAELYALRSPDEKREQRALLAWAQAAPEAAEPWRRLSTNYERRRRYQEQLEALDMLARLSPSTEERADASLRGASLCVNKLSDDTGALDRIAQFAHVSRAPLPLELLDMARTASGLTEVCDLCEATGRYQQFCELLRERIELCVDPERKVELYRRLATAQIEHLQDEQAALWAYEGLLVLIDDLDALRFVQAWASRHDDPKRLAEVLSRLAHIEPDMNERRDLWWERGRILRLQLGDIPAAIEAFEEALGIDPDYEPALDELLVTSELAGDNARFASALERKLQRGAAEPLPVLERLSDLYEGALCDDTNAISALRRWSERDPQNPVPLRRLRTLYKRQNRPRELLATLDTLAICEQSRAQSVEASVAAADLAYHQLADAAGAFERLAPLVADCDPAADRTLLVIAERTGRMAELYELLERAGRFADLAYHLERAARQASEPELRADFLRRTALVLHNHLNDVERTGSAYAELLTLEEDEKALRFMLARALELDDTDAVADNLLRLSRLDLAPSELRDLLFDFAHLQHYHLRAPNQAIPVLLRILSELDPDFTPALDELLAAAQAANDDDAAVFALNRKIEREPDSLRKAEYAQRLADLYEARGDDDERTLASLKLWASLDPRDTTPLRRLRAFHEQRAQHAELLQCLDRIAVQSDDRAEQHEVAFAAARLCLGPLGDVDAAFVRLTDLASSGAVRAEDALHKLAFEHGRVEELCSFYEQNGRFEEVCELLRKRANAEPDVGKRAELRLRTARLLAHTMGDEHGASEAYRQVLSLREDLEALQYLRQVAERQDDAETLEQILEQLARTVPDIERLPIEHARALLLRDRLGAAPQACELLRKLLADLATVPSDFLLRDRIVTELEATAEQTSDRASLAIALEARLDTLRESTQRRTVALHLADLCESELADPDRAASALRIACSADPRHLQARRRLRAHLARQKAHQEYYALLDTLVHLEPNPADRREARLSAARCAHEHLNDPAGALTRLGPLVQSGDSEAERLAEEIARAGGLGRELSTLYIARARQATSVADAENSWHMVMTIHEEWLQDPAEAFEAALRLLAADPQSRKHLDHVDRLATTLQAFKRLAGIYAKLIRSASNDATRVELNLRLSRLLETHGQGQAALEYALQAARSVPADAQLIDRVARLAASQASPNELFWAQEQRALSTREPSAAIAAWLEAARTADLALHDREQANSCLRRALALTEHAPEQADTILQLAADLDAARPELGVEDARRGLLRAHLELSEQVSPEFRIQLILRAARFASDALQDDRTGFDVLRGGAALPPFSEELLHALEETAQRIQRLDALDAQLARSTERAEDAADKERLLKRRARVLTDQLQRFDQAAQVYERLLELTPDDPAIATQHLDCLRKSGRHRELLRACERRLPRVQEADAKLALMREMAVIWEFELKNRASALAIWADVQALEPRDDEAARALERLQSADAS